MARAAVAVKAILTEEDVAARWGLEVNTVRIRRRNGEMPPHMQLSKSATKGTIRYRLVDIEAYEESLLVDPVAATA